MRASTLLFIVMLIAAVCHVSHAGPTFEGVNRNQLRKTILPKPDENKWLSIPWEVSIWKARQRAAKEGKPILLWEMDGHPMGCT